MYLFLSIFRSTFHPGVFLKNESTSLKIASSTSCMRFFSHSFPVWLIYLDDIGETVLESVVDAFGSFLFFFLLIFFYLCKFNNLNKYVTYISSTTNLLVRI